MIDSVSQKEALINEYKGNLFEYVVANGLAKNLGVEDKFIEQISPGFKNKLKFYEKNLFELDRDCLSSLPTFAQKLIPELLKNLQSSSCQWTGVYLVGKMTRGINHHLFKEGDIILVDSSNQFIPVSIKFCKQDSFVNTKSAGIKSFVSQYFKLFDDGPQWQEAVNFELQERFDEMAKKMYRHVGLEYIKGFCSKWAEAGLPDRPGRLPVDLNVFCRQFYVSMINTLYQSILNFYEKNPESFFESLLPLLGLSHPSMVQATCFHNGTQAKNRYQFSSFHFLDGRQFDPKKEFVELKSPKKDLSSFEIVFRDKILQIRVKPMNAFTVPGLKVNCSTKYL